jgi:hypothetical protein
MAVPIAMTQDQRALQASLLNQVAGRVLGLPR